MDGADRTIRICSAASCPSSVGRKSAKTARIPQREGRSRFRKRVSALCTCDYITLTSRYNCLRDVLNNQFCICSTCQQRLVDAIAVFYENCKCWSEYRGEEECVDIDCCEWMSSQLPRESLRCPNPACSADIGRIDFRTGCVIACIDDV